MARQAWILFFGLSAVFLFSGCYTARTYVVNKPRVDQDIPGQPEQGPVKTRKMVVLEVVEKDKAHPVAVQAFHPAGAAEVVQENDFALPQGALETQKPDTMVQGLVPQDYVVEKDDTLQKISKKVYGAYSKWTKIYEANRDVIKDPNFLKPGITLKIPVLQETAAGGLPSTN